MVINNSQAYFLGTVKVKGTLEDHLDSSKVGDHPRILFSDTLPVGILPFLKSGTYAGAVFTKESPFSHNANLIRATMRIPSATQTFALGAVQLRSVLRSGAMCEIDPTHKTISIEGKSFFFSQSGRFYYDNIATLCRNPLYVCYKPGYYYQAEFARLVSRGYSMLAKSLLGIDVISQADRSGQLWVQGIGWPSAVSRWALANSHAYLAASISYCHVLEEMLLSCTTKNEISHFTSLLEFHYMYSPLVSLPVNGFVAALSEEPSRDTGDLETLLNLVSWMSPISNPQQGLLYHLHSALTMISEFSPSLNEGNSISEEVFLFSTNGKRFPFNRTAVSDLLLTALTLADIRRAVVSKLRAENSWFRSITSHRDILDKPITG